MCPTQYEGRGGTLFCLQLVSTFCGYSVNSSYRNIIDYRDNLVRISQNIEIAIFWLSHRLRVHTEMKMSPRLVC